MIYCRRRYGPKYVLSEPFENELHFTKEAL